MNRAECTEKLNTAKRVVLKVGTSLLTDSQSEDGINDVMIRRLRDEILYLKKRGLEVVLVSSGAQGMGRQHMKRFGKNVSSDSPSIGRKQAYAAVGQGRLMSVYADVFEKSGMIPAQVLITAREFRDRRTYLNIGQTIEELLSMDVLPVVNENDTVSTDELQFGDNDVLSAACASLIQADVLIILTSVDGFLKNGERVAVLDEISSEDMSHAGPSSGPGTGGMQTKLRAGRLCSMSGAQFAILPGRHESPVQYLFEGKDIGTVLCTGVKHKLSARKQWILYSRNRGSIIIDRGAQIALQEKGSSLLPAGIIQTEGEFFSGDAVEIRDAAGISLGRGISNYSHREILRMKGRKITDLKNEGHSMERSEVIHRDNLILENDQSASSFS